jgi:DNA-binding NtrC family response regulator
VRELQNVCERAGVLAKTETIERSLIEGWLVTAPAPAAGTSNVVQVSVRPPMGFGAISSLNGTIAESKPFTLDRLAGSAVTEGRSLEEIEREAIVLTLHRFHGHRQRTATALGIGVRTLGLKLKKWKEMKLVEETL